MTQHNSSETPIFGKILFGLERHVSQKPKIWFCFFFHVPRNFNIAHFGYPACGWGRSAKRNLSARVRYQCGKIGLYIGLYSLHSFVLCRQAMQKVGQLDPRIVTADESQGTQSGSEDCKIGMIHRQCESVGSQDAA